MRSLKSTNFMQAMKKSNDSSISQLEVFESNIFFIDQNVMIFQDDTKNIKKDYNLNETESINLNMARN